MVLGWAVGQKDEEKKTIVSIFIYVIGWDVRVKWMFLGLMFVSTQAYAETRQEIRERQDESNFQYNIKSGERFHENEKAFGEALAKSQALGLTEKSDVPPTSDKQDAGAVVFRSSSTDVLLVLRLSCDLEDSPFPQYMRYRTAKWSIPVGKSSGGGKDLVGETQSDSQGYVRIGFASKESVRGKKMKLEIGDIQKEVELGVGPYELFFPEKVCFSKR